MNILTADNKSYNLNNLPDVVDDMQFNVLDNSNPADPDFFFIPLIFLESFNSPAMVLKIGEHEVALPLEWQIAIGDPQSGCDVEIIPLTSINNRGFDAMCFNPVSGFMVEFKPIEIVNFYTDVKWHFPKLRAGQLLSIPINNTEKPMCIFIIKDVSRQFDLIDLSKVL